MWEHSASPSRSSFWTAPNPAMSVHFVSEGLEGEISTWGFIGVSLIPPSVVYTVCTRFLHRNLCPESTQPSVNTAFSFTSVDWTVFLCDMHRRYPKAEGSLFQNAQICFRIAFVSGAFPVHLSLLSLSMAHQDLRGQDGPGSVEPADCR